MDHFISVNNLKKYNPNYTDGRRLIWVRYDIAAIREYKLLKQSPEGRWLHLVLVCLATENKNYIPYDIEYLASQSGIQENCITKLLNRLQKYNLIVTSCDNLSPTDRQTDEQTNEQGVDISFNEIWKRYPKKIGKRVAEKYYNDTVKTIEDWERINKALDNYLKSERVLKGKIQDGKNWFAEWQDWENYSEEVCPKCKGSGEYISDTNYKVFCTCPVGKRKKEKK